MQAAAAAMSALCAACTSLGPRQVPIDRFDYNSAIARSADEQMLLNLVRLRFNEVPVFLAVNSVLTQYVWTGEVSVNAAGGESLGFPAWTVGGSGAARYLERPTVTYSPLSGQEFAGQLISPVRADLVFSLISSGWPPDQLLVMTLQRINGIRNRGFVSAGEPGDPAAEFQRAVDLIIQLSGRDAIELVRSTSPDGDDPILNFAEGADPETQSLIRDLKDLLDLDQERARFRVTRKIVGRGPDEITVRMHSLLELMGLLSAGVELAGGQAGQAGAPHEATPDDPAVPLRVRCVHERPADAFVAVQFREQWFYIANEDQRSKRAFGLLNYLFQMQASQNQGAGPLLTVPVG